MEFIGSPENYGPADRADVRRKEMKEGTIAQPQTPRCTAKYEELACEMEAGHLGLHAANRFHRNFTECRIWTTTAPTAPDSPTLRDAETVREFLWAHCEASPDCKAPHDAIERIVAELDTLRAALREAQRARTVAKSGLEKWGRHHAWCQKATATMDVKGWLPPCNCGYEQAIADADPVNVANGVSDANTPPEPTCAETTGRFRCDRPVNHEGDHQSHHASGGMIGWRNRLSAPAETPQKCVHGVALSECNYAHRPPAEKAMQCERVTEHGRCGRLAGHIGAHQSRQFIAPLRSPATPDFAAGLDRQLTQQAELLASSQQEVERLTAANASLRTALVTIAGKNTTRIDAQVVSSIQAIARAALPETPTPEAKS